MRRTRSATSSNAPPGRRALLLHPESLEAHDCRIAVSRRGLVLCRTARDGAEGAPTRVPWWAVQGFSADETGIAPDGTRCQVLEVVTDAGTLSFLVPAAEVSGLLAEVSRRSSGWQRSRRPLAAAAARDGAIMAGALAGVLAGPLRLVAESLRPIAAGTGAATGLVRAVSGAAARAVIPWVVAAVRMVVIPLAALLRPAGRRLSASVVGLAAAAVWRHGRLRPILVASLSLLVAGGTVLATAGAGAPAPGSVPAPSGLALSLGKGRGGSTLAHMVRVLQQRATAKPVDLPAATAPPAPAPPSLANEPPLLPHETFGFAPYWTLTQSAGFDVAGLTTVAYFSIDVNANGSLDESGSGWDGYESQALADLVNRAHAAGVRVVLTITCFSQASLDALTSSATAPATLSGAVVQAIEAKNLDGVNIDFEGDGSADQAGLTSLVTQVSSAVHAANPHYQVSMDTYASSAGDPQGFFDIPALAPVVDAFFVMAYQLNLQAATTPASPLTSSMFSDLATAEQYTAVVSPAKVIMGAPYYGLQWPTDNGTMSAQSTGAPTPVTYAQVAASGHPVYWDPVTDTAWTSFQVGGQWYEDYFEDPTSLYLVAQMSQSFGLGGVGVWALGMDGNDPAMLSALDGLAPATKDGAAGPASTSPSVGPAVAPAQGPVQGPVPTTTPASAGGPVPTTTPTTAGGPVATTTTVPTTTPTTTVPTTTPTTGTTSFRYTGIWVGQQVSLSPESATWVASGTPVYLGELTGFQTDDPRFACLEAAPGLEVWAYGSTPTQDVVVADQPADCITGELTFPAEGVSGAGTAASNGVVGQAAHATMAPLAGAGPIASSTSTSTSEGTTAATATARP